jgi:hypothetical protein
MASAPYPGLLWRVFVIALSWFWGSDVGERLMDRGPAHYAQNQASDDSSPVVRAQPWTSSLLSARAPSSATSPTPALANFSSWPNARTIAQLSYALILLWTGSFMGPSPIAENGLALHTRQHPTVLTRTLCHRLPLGGHCHWTCAAPK